MTYYSFRDNNGNGTYDVGVDDNFNSPNICTVTDYIGLVDQGNGQCGSWASFMIAALESQGLEAINGVDNKVVAVVARLGNGFAVNN